MDRTRAPRARRDGWTVERQLSFLDALALTRSVSRAASIAGMSRESAYRLRERPEGALFARLWDRVLQGHNLHCFGLERWKERVQTSTSSSPRTM